MTSLREPNPAVGHRATRQPNAVDHRRLLVAGALVAGTAVAIYTAALLAYPRTSLLKGFDLHVYRIGGLLVRHNPRNLYSWQLRPGIRFTYTPFAALIFALLPLVTMRESMNIMTALSVLALIATVWIAFRELGLRGNARIGAALIVAGVAFWSQPVQRALYVGQIELVLMGIVVWDLCQPGHRRWKGAATGIAAGIKLVPLIFIPYLLLTRQFRQAAVAAGAFAATVTVGFVELPNASVAWWLHGYFLRASRTGFIGETLNQSLRGTLTRLAGSVVAGQPLWLAAVVVTAAAGMAAAAALNRLGRSFEGLMVCALTALLISPISWDHHWVWVAPGLAVFLAGAIPAPGARARLGWAGAATVLAGLFLAWPRVWLRRAGPVGGGLLGYAPGTRFGHGDSPSFVEYHLHGLQLVAGNLYVLAGCCLLLLALVAAGLAVSRSTARQPHGRRQLQV